MKEIYAKSFERPENEPVKLELSKEGKFYRITFTSFSVDKCRAYNFALRNVLRKKKLEADHFLNSSDPNDFDAPGKSGKHGYEILFTGETNCDFTDKEKRNLLDSLLPEIENEAEKILNE